MKLNPLESIILDKRTTLNPINKKDWQVFNLQSFVANKKYIDEDVSKYYTLTMLDKQGFEYSHCAIKDIDIDIQRATFKEYVYCEAVFIFILKGKEIFAAYWVERKE